MRAKKQFGQNFLKSPSIARRIVAAGDVVEGDHVLEIGPGKGALTKILLEAGARVTAVEMDADLIPLLSETFASEIAAGQLTIVEGDALELDTLNLGSYKLIANIPYYITGALLRYYLESKNQPATIVMLVQKEVAERVVARDNKHSILSLSVHCYGTPKYIEKVPARYFTPAPKIDSAVLAIKDISKDFFTDISETSYFSVVKTAFAQRRKTLNNNLCVSYPKESVRTALAHCAVEEKARPEDVPLTIWKCLVLSLE